ncbi:MAG: hypothetical protein ABR927_16070 [Bacteroidales bacterium]|jgi:hypothetical protein
MKWGKIIAILIPIISITCCKKDNSIENAACNNLTSVDSWTTISLKTNYTIQIPSGFKGLGMAGFEGNTFSKFSNDTTIILEYGYCNNLFCNDFGDTLQTTIPLSIKVKDNSNNLVTLDKIQRFCQNAETIGVLYYSNDSISDSKLYWNSRLYWKDNGLFKQAMQIKFPASGLETVNEIIETIKTR